MTEAPVDIPSDVLEAARLAAIPAHEPPAAGENPAPPAEKVGCFLSFFSPVFFYGSYNVLVRLAKTP